VRILVYAKRDRQQSVSKGLFGDFSLAIRRDLPFFAQTNENEGSRTWKAFRNFEQLVAPTPGAKIVRTTGHPKSLLQ
jgi:hypothetical protein